MAVKLLHIFFLLKALKIPGLHVITNLGQVNPGSIFGEMYQ